MENIAMIVLTVMVAVLTALLLMPNFAYFLHKRHFMWRNSMPKPPAQGDLLKALCGCPLCSGTGILNSKPVKLKFRGFSFEVDAYGYTCDKCGEEYTDVNTDQATINVLHRQYTEATTANEKSISDSTSTTR